MAGSVSGMLSRQAAELQDEHESRVLANRVQVERRWGQACRAYNLCVSVGAGVTGELAEAQESVLAAEPSLLRVPEQAMHISAAWLVPVQLGLSDEAKDRLWEREGARWQDWIAGALAGVAPFRLRVRDVVATDGAVIALAWPADQVNAVRGELAGRLRARVSAGALVHTTLFRYGSPLADPAGLLAALRGLTVGAEVTVSEFVLVKETVFPSLERDVLGRFALA
jgi:hypothetical protein